MATIGQINTVLTTNTGPLSKGLGKAGGMFRSFGTSISGVITRLGPLAAGIAGVAGVGGMGMMVKSSLDSIDALAKTSRTIGIATETLGGFHHAAGLSGVETKALDKSLQRMQRSISEAASRGGVAGDNFEQLGLSVESLSAMSPEDQFIAIGEAINQIPLQADKTRLAMELLGRGGADSLRLLEGGSDALRSSLQEARDLGIAPSAEEAAKVEAANDAILRMKSAFTGVANTLAVQVAPWIEYAADKMRGWIAAGITAFGQLKAFVVDSFTVIGFAWENMGEIAGLVWEKTKLGAVSFWEDLKYLFTVQIPNVLTWFADQWQNILFTAVDYGLTLFINLGKNIRALWDGVLNFIAGNGFDVNFTPLTEGFVNTIEALPDVGERELTALEKQLQGNVDRIGGNLSMQLAEVVTPDQAMSTGGVASPTQESAPEAAEELAEAATKLKDLEGPASIQRGSADAFSAIFAAMRGDSAQDMIAKTSQEQLKEQKKQTAALSKIANTTPIELVAGAA